MILKLDITADPVLFQIQQVLFAAVAAVRSHCLQAVSTRFSVLFQNRDQRIVICPVVAHISMDNKIVLYRDLEVIGRLKLPIKHRNLLSCA